MIEACILATLTGYEVHIMDAHDSHQSRTLSWIVDKKQITRTNLSDTSINTNQDKLFNGMA